MNYHELVLKKIDNCPDRKQCKYIPEVCPDTCKGHTTTVIFTNIHNHYAYVISVQPFFINTQALTHPSCMFFDSTVVRGIFLK